MPNSTTYSWILDVKANTNKIVSGFKSVVKGTEKVEGNVKGINKAANKTVSTFKSIAGAAGLAFGAAQVVNFTKDLIKLSGEVEGVDRAFNQIADKDYLESLKKSTAGTVSELNLMKRAVQANNFDIPLKDLGKLFEFATARAQQTGESVDHLVDSIVLGIGRKSPLILDNLGISAIRLREELKGVSAQAATVGDVAAVVGKIAGTELEKMGGIADTAATKIANIAAEWENFKKDLSQDEGFADAVKGQLDDVQRETAFFFSDDISNWKKWSTFIKGIFSEDAYERGLEAFEKAQKKLENFNRTFEDEDSNEYRNRIAGLTDTIETQITTYGDLKTQIKETSALLETADVTDTNYIKTLFKEIDALEKRKKAFEDLAKPVKRIATPELMATGRGGEDLSVSLSKEELKAFDQANKSLDSMNEFIQTNIDEVAAMNEGWESYIDTMIRVAQQHDLLQGGLTNLHLAGLAFTEGLMQSAQSADLNLKNLGQTIKSVVGDSIRAFIAEGVAGAVSTAIAKSGIPFPFNMAAGAIAAAGAVALFNSIIPGFESGGVIPGTQLTGDRKLIRANSGEEVLRRDDPRHRYNNSSRMAANNVRPIILQPSIEYTARGFKVMLNEVDYADSRRRG